MRPAGLLALGAWIALSATAVPCRGEGSPDSAVVAPADKARAETPEAVERGADGLEPLVPELAAHPYRLEPGVRPFRNRISLSPAYGTFGTQRLYALRVAYYPSSWLGYEAGIGHNPGHAVHAVLHTISAIVRRPLSGRFQPYATAGYGMAIVFSGPSLNAAPVTKNTLNVGAGLECYVRGDLALRAELRRATVFGQQRDREGIVAYDYLQGTIGLAFYRSLRP